MILEILELKYGCMMNSDSLFGKASIELNDRKVLAVCVDDFLLSFIVGGL